MRFTRCLLSALLFLPFIVFTLPLQLCRVFDSLPEDGAVPCELRFPIHRSIDEGHPRRKTRSAKEPADTDAIPLLKLREDFVKHFDNKSEGYMRRAVAFALLKMGKQGPGAESHAARALEKRWRMGFNNIPALINAIDDAADAVEETTRKRRWQIPVPGAHGSPLVVGNSGLPLPDDDSSFNITATNITATNLTSTNLTFINLTSTAPRDNS